MDYEDAQQRVSELEEAIASALRSSGPGPVSDIHLSKGSEHADLSSNVDVMVRTGEEEREFSFITLKALNNLFAQLQGMEHDDDLYTTGGPLLVVERISPDVIVRGVIKFLAMEAM